jgi:hypothetical protein
MNLSLESAFVTAREFRRRITRLTSHFASRGAVYTLHALRLARSARDPHATVFKLQTRNREKFAVEARATSERNSVYATAGDRDRQSSLCNVSNFPVRTSIGRIRSEIGTREGVTVERVGTKPLRFMPATSTRFFEAAVAGDCTSAFNFKSLEDLSSDLAATLQQIRVDADTLKEAATGNDKVHLANGPNDLNMNNDQRIESAGEVELCILILTETAGALREIFCDRPDLLPREFLDDLQQANRKIVKRLSDVSFKEHKFRRNQVLH